MEDDIMKKSGIKTALTYLQIISAAIILAFTYQLFIVENDFAPAGINGIATMVQYKTGFSIAYMSLLVNIPLCFLAYFLVDKGFAKRSLCFCLVYSLTFLSLQRLGLEAFQYDAQGHDTVFPVILSGILGGVVYGLCFRVNSSTGGTDIVSKYISKIKPSLNFFWVTFTLNAIVATVSFFVYATPDSTGSLSYDYKPVCLCVMYCFISSFVGSYIIRGTKSAYKITVITSYAEEITKEVVEKLHHSTTILSGEGGFSHSKNQVLICVVNKHQLVDFKDIIKKYDHTFSFSEAVGETYGNFKHIK